MAGEPKLPKEIQALLDKLEPEMQAEFLKAVAGLKSSVKIKSLAKAISEGRIEDVVKALSMSPDRVRDLNAVGTKAFVEGGKLAAAQIKPLPTQGGVTTGSFGFDAQHPRAEQWASNDSSKRITMMDNEEQRDQIRSMVKDGISAGKSGDQIGLELVGRINKATGKREGGIVGLSAPQMRSMELARKELESGNYNAFMGRTRRDKRLDKAMNAAIASKGKLSQAQIDRALDQYSNSLLLLRGEMIGRTEALNALRAGRREGFQQLVDSGKADDKYIKRTWRTSGDVRVREAHIAMSGKIITGMATPWTFPDGTKAMHPGDSSLGASGADTIMCRCYEEYEVDYIAMRKAARGATPPMPEPPADAWDPMSVDLNGWDERSPILGLFDRFGRPSLPAPEFKKRVSDFIDARGIDDIRKMPDNITGLSTVGFPKATPKLAKEDLADLKKLLLKNIMKARATKKVVGIDFDLTERYRKAINKSLVKEDPTPLITKKLSPVPKPESAKTNKVPTKAEEVFDIKDDVDGILTKRVQRTLNALPAMVREQLQGMRINVRSFDYRANYNGQNRELNLALYEDADTIAHEIFHALDHRFQTNAFSNGSGFGNPLYWATNNEELNQLALAAAKEFKRRDSKGKGSLGRDGSYYLGDWDHEYEARNYDFERNGVSHEYITMGAQDYYLNVRRADKGPLEQAFKKRPALKALLDYMWNMERL